MKRLILLIVAIMALCITSQAQTIYEAKNAPKADEKEIGSVSLQIQAGDIYYYKDNQPNEDDRKTYSDEVLLSKLVYEAKVQYGKTYPMLKLRNFKSRVSEEKTYDCEYFNTYTRYYYYSATVVVPSYVVTDNALPQAIDKALKNIKEGSRLAISQLSVSEGVDEDAYKDRIVDILLDKGYKVVAKEYLQKLYEEQQQQGTGVYNDTTTAQRNNFSAAGYYLNVKVTMNSLRVQVINVSTGEYEGNATVNF